MTATEYLYLALAVLAVVLLGGGAYLLSGSRRRKQLPHVPGEPGTPVHQVPGSGRQGGVLEDTATPVDQGALPELLDDGLTEVGLEIGQMDVIELNEAFAAQGLAVTRDLGLADDAAHVNPNGGAIAIGHPLGASGARLVTTALNQLEQTSGRYALCTMCIGVGQGIALVIERL